MLANNEIGVIQPVTEIGELCQERGIPFHTDAAQAAANIPIDVHYIAHRERTLARQARA